MHMRVGAHRRAPESCGRFSRINDAGLADVHPWAIEGLNYRTESPRAFICVRCVLHVLCDCLAQMKPELKEWDAVVIVVSTTGNGDAPENTERFWRYCAVQHENETFTWARTRCIPILHTEVSSARSLCSRHFHGQQLMVHGPVPRFSLVGPVGVLHCTASRCQSMGCVRMCACMSELLISLVLRPLGGDSPVDELRSSMLRLGSEQPFFDGEKRLSK